ncbi:MAG: hypothetical protein KKA07_14245 [Bacteroidetes bacterium]|nr:hypothetical protein [Bacteroidota bacterium]MBU1720223.1 hypothetical protein [Bacteroidota bacterium]
MQSLKNRWFMPAVVAVIAVVFIVRKPFFTNEMHSHDDCIFQSLVVYENWEQQGGGSFNWCPVQTWSNPGDKFHAHYARLVDQNGNNYYTSYPPLSFLFTYNMMHIFGLEISKLSLHIIGFILHIISSILLFLILLELIAGERKYFAAFLGFCAYISSPVTQYFSHDILFPELWGQVFWIASVYYWLRVHQNSGGYLRKFLFIFLIFIGLCVEWLSFFFAFSLWIHFIWNWRKAGGKWVRVFIPIVLVIALAFATLWFSSLNGVQSYLKSLSIRFVERAGYFGANYSADGMHFLSLKTWVGLAWNHISSLMPWIAFFPVFLFALLMKMKFSLMQRKLLSLPWLLIWFPAFLYTFSLFNLSATHYHLVAKWMFPLSVFIGVATDWTLRNFEGSRRLIMTAIIVSFVSGFSISLFLFSEKEKQQAALSDTQVLKEIAFEISTTASPFDAIFVESTPSCPNLQGPLTYMTKRNIVEVASMNDAKLRMIGIENPSITMYYCQFDTLNRTCSCSR